MIAIDQFEQGTASPTKITNCISILVRGGDDLSSKDILQHRVIYWKQLIIICNPIAVHNIEQILSCRKRLLKTPTIETAK